MSFNFKITKKETNEKLFTIHINKNIYTGGTSKECIDQTNNKILYKHAKSITHITSSENYLACSSYDCTVSLFKNDKFEDIIEGPDTEIKCVSISGYWLAFCTRGKTVWICTIKDIVEIFSILEDHTEDVKGCIFYMDMLFTYGYDCSIKVYQYFDTQQSWELVQSLDSDFTVWKVIFFDMYMFVSNDNGEILKYELERGWILKLKKKLSFMPIQALSNYKNYLICTVNLGNLVFLSERLEIVHVIEKLHNDVINCIFWSEKDSLIGTCSDDKSYCILKTD